MENEPEIVAHKLIAFFVGSIDEVTREMRGGMRVDGGMRRGHDGFLECRRKLQEFLKFLKFCGNTIAI